MYQKKIVKTKSNEVVYEIFGDDFTKYHSYKKKFRKKMLTSSMLIKNKLFAKVNQKYFFLEKNTNMY